MILKGSSRTDPRLVLGSALALALPLGAHSAAFAQSAPSQIPAGAGQTPAAPSVPAAAPLAAAQDALKQHDQELDAVRAQERASAESQAKLRREIESIGDDRRTLNQQLIDTAARVRDVEATIEATRARLKPLDDQEGDIRKSLDERRTAIVEILAALQRIGRQPPPALLVRPEDALQAVRTAIALGAVLPDMRAQGDALAGDLADLLAVRKDIATEHDRLAHDLDLLGREQLRMNVLIEERQKKQTASEEALDAERTRATDLANQASIRRRAKRMPRRARSRRTPPGPTLPRSRIQGVLPRRSPLRPRAGICVCRSTA